jgi:hypothetical protein
VQKVEAQLTIGKGMPYLNAPGEEDTIRNLVEMVDLAERFLEGMQLKEPYIETKLTHDVKPGKIRS